MSKEMTVIALGIWVLILPHLGVPGSWHTAINTATGILIICTGLYWRATMLSRGMRRSSHHPFVENTGSDDSSGHGYHEHGQEKARVN